MSLEVIEKKHVDAALTALLRDGEPAGRGSRGYVVPFKGKLFAPKSIVSRAYREATGRPLAGNAFDSGQALRLLRRVAGLEAGRARVAVTIAFLVPVRNGINSDAVARAAEVSLSQPGGVDVLVMASAPELNQEVRALLAHIPRVVAHQVVERVPQVRILEPEGDDLVLSGTDLGTFLVHGVSVLVGTNRAFAGAIDAGQELRQQTHVGLRPSVSVVVGPMDEKVRSSGLHVALVADEGAYAPEGIQLSTSNVDDEGWGLVLASVRL